MPMRPRGDLQVAADVKEELLERWDAQLLEADLNARQGETVTSIRRGKGAFDVETASGSTYRGRRVLLAIGKRGNPRKLGVPGEDLEKVAYKLYEDCFAIWPTDYVLAAHRRRAARCDSVIDLDYECYLIIRHRCDLH